MTEHLLLGIDLGTSSVKVVVVDLNGAILGSGSTGYPTRRPEPDHAEQDPATWWRATVAATHAALIQAKTSAIAAIGVTGQMHGTVLLDAAHETLAPAIIWADRRSSGEAAAMTAEVGAEHLISIAGSPIAPGFQAATLRWIQDRRPGLRAQIHRVLTPKDYLRWILTAEHGTDPSDASGTLLFDVRNRDWSEDLLHAAGIGRDLLPPLRRSGEIAGHLTVAAAAELGLPPRIPVATGGADAPCAALGSGVVGNDSLLLTFSTGSQALLPRDDPDVDLTGRLHTFCSVLDPTHAGPGWYTMGATLTAGLALTWLRERVFELPPLLTTAEMLGWARNVPAGSRGLVFLPYLTGERTPLMDPKARGVFLGMTVRHGRGELIRATLEGVAFAAYDAFLALRTLGGSPQRVLAAGGGARMPLWRQVVADVFRLPVYPLISEEQTALGAAILAGTSIGVLEPIAAAASWSRTGPPSVTHDPAAALYGDLFPVFQRTYRYLKNDMSLLGEIEARSDALAVAV